MRGLRDVFAFIPIIQRTCYTKMTVVGMMLCIVLLVNQSNGTRRADICKDRGDTALTRREEREAEKTGENRLTGWREHKRKKCEMDG